SESMLQSIVAHVPNFITKIDREGTILFINRTVPGLTRADVIGSTLFSFIPPDERQRLREIIARAFETGKTEVFEMQARGADDTLAWYETHLGPVRHDGQIVGLILVSNDITARKQMVDALRESEEQFRMLAETVPAAVAIYQDGRQKYCNRALELITGHSRKEILGQDLAALVHPGDQPMVIARSLARQRGDAVPDRYEFRIVTKQGKQRFVDFVAARIEYEGRPAILGTALDITKRRQAEQTLLQSERRLQFQRDVLEEIASGKRLPRVLDTLCRLVEQAVPPSLCSILFLDEAQGRLRFGVGPSLPSEIIDVVDGMQIGEQAGSCGTAAHTKLPAIVTDTRIDPRWHGMRALAEKLGIYACWSVPILSDAQDVLGTFAISHSEPANPTPFEMEILETASHLAGIAIMRQKSEEMVRQQESQLAHAARLATMGEMVAGIAHEISQPLSAIGNFSAASTSMLESDADDRVRRTIQFHRRISEQAHRAGSIIERLRNFVRRSDPHRSECNLRELILESVALLDSEARRFRATVHIGSISATLRVEVDAIQIQQVIVNLLRNAFEAMNGIGEARRYVWIDVRIDQQQVEIAITDSGPGIPPTRRHQVFEAFYTSKESGMGMGLAVSRSIVDAHGGRFWTDTPHDKGAAFHFTIPATFQPSEVIPSIDGA
ncbi:MAG: PAS domain S-box protein, partial [Pirellulales bacterium]